MILKTTSVIMTVIEYSIFRGKSYNAYQWIAVALICTAVVLIAFFSGCNIVTARLEGGSWYQKKR